MLMDHKIKSISKRRLFTTLGAVFVLAILSGLTVWPQGPDWFGRPMKLHLGLDLQGGAHLEYQADLKTVPVEDRDQVVDLDEFRELVESSF